MVFVSPHSGPGGVVGNLVAHADVPRHRLCDVRALPFFIDSFALHPLPSGLLIGRMDGAVKVGRVSRFR